MAKKALITDEGQLMFFPTDWFDRGAWLREKRAIQDTLRQLDREIDASKEKKAHWLEWHGKLNWDIGDWVLGGKRGGIKVRELRNHVNDVVRGKNLASGTLSNITSVCNAIEFSRRREDVPFSMHVLVAPFAPAKQDRLLELAFKNLEHNRKYSVRDFKKAIAADKFQEDSEFEWEMIRKQDRKQPLTEDEKRRLAALEKQRLGIKDFEKISITLSRTDFELLQSFAVAKFPEKGRPVPVFLMWMAAEYFKAHKADLQLLVDAYQAQQKAKAEELHKRQVAQKAEDERRRREELSPERRARVEARDEAGEAYRDAMIEGKTSEEAVEIAKRVQEERFAFFLEKFSADSLVAIAEK